MQRHGRQGDAELCLHHGADRAGALLALGEQLQNSAAHRIAEHLERVHAAIIPACD
jgi:hypothetical protein